MITKAVLLAGPSCAIDEALELAASSSDHARALVRAAVTKTEILLLNRRAHGTHLEEDMSSSAELQLATLQQMILHFFATGHHQYSGDALRHVAVIKSTSTSTWPAWR
mmetsp:Transcript_1974/g.4939  ORF Transcript_1974/g.4939 Transcript_1974/m.4939 type:complete len:108 (+) Transcript_1974:74-397(+)